MTNSKIRLVVVLLILILPPLLFWSLGFQQWQVLAVVVSVIGLWLSEALPLPVTGLLVPVLACFYGLLPAAKAFEQFGSDILFLFLGCFLISRSMEKHGLDRRIAYFLLGRCMMGNSFFSINLVIGLASFVLSMWISNTSAAAIMTVITVGILSSLDSKLPDAETRSKVSTRLLLTCAFAASIGGLATPIGSPPNLIALKFLEDSGITISFIEWVIVGLPISLAMFVILLGLFQYLFPLKGLVLPGVKEDFSESLRNLGPMKTGEIQIAAIFALTISLWILPDLLISVLPDNSLVLSIKSRLSMSMVGLFGALLTFVLPVQQDQHQGPNLKWSETNNIDWGTLLLFGGGLTLGLLIEKSGIAKDLGQLLFSGEANSLLVMTILVVIVSIILSEFASNTAAAAILIPLIISACIAKGEPTQVTTSIVLAATFGSSFGFMLPVSTPPNAIIYGTGKVSAAQMRRAGVLFDILGAVVIVISLTFR
jgi:sodium-dependent dicarboxylate transporter 2/3/5